MAKLNRGKEVNGEKKHTVYCQIPDEIYKGVKIQCVLKNVTLTTYILQAILEKLVHEKQYQ